MARLPCRPDVMPIETIAAAEAKNGSSLSSNVAAIYQAALAATAICRIDQPSERRGARPVHNALRNEVKPWLSCQAIVEHGLLKTPLYLIRPLAASPIFLLLCTLACSRARVKSLRLVRAAVASIHQNA